LTAIYIFSIQRACAYVDTFNTIFGYGAIAKFLDSEKTDLLFLPSQNLLRNKLDHTEFFEGDDGQLLNLNISFSLNTISHLKSISPIPFHPIQIMSCLTHHVHRNDDLESYVLQRLNALFPKGTNKIFQNKIKLSSILFDIVTLRRRNVTF